MGCFKRQKGGSRTLGGNREFKCWVEGCGKLFYERSAFKKHMSVHGEKLFQCPYNGCNKKFLDNAKLKRHVLVHTVSFLFHFIG